MINIQYKSQILNTTLQRTYRVHSSEEVPVLLISNAWKTLFQPKERSQLTEVLTGSLLINRWSGNSERPMRGGQIIDVIPMPYETTMAYMALIHIDYADGSPFIYALPLAYADSGLATQIQATLPKIIMAHVWSLDGYGILYHALWNAAFCRALINAIAHQRSLEGEHGRIVATPAKAFRYVFGQRKTDTNTDIQSISSLQPQIVSKNQCRTSVIYDNQLFMKFFQPLSEGINPELEVCSFLSEKTTFHHVARVVGRIEYNNRWDEPTPIAMVQEYITHEQDVRTFTLDVLSHYFDDVVASHDLAQTLILPSRLIVHAAQEPIPPEIETTIGSYMYMAKLLGQRTAEMHLALCNYQGNPLFTPEPFTNVHQRHLYHAISGRLTGVCHALQHYALYDDTRSMEVQEFLMQSEQLQHYLYETLMRRILKARRICCHGNYRLEHLLTSGYDVAIIHFAQQERLHASVTQSNGHYTALQKHSALYDVASLLYDLHETVAIAIENKVANSIMHHEQYQALLELWGYFWYRWVSVALLKPYLKITCPLPFMPRQDEEISGLFHCYLLNVALKKLEYALKESPEQLYIPLRTILQLAGVVKLPVV